MDVDYIWWTLVAITIATPCKEQFFDHRRTSEKDRYCSDFDRRTRVACKDLAPAMLVPTQGSNILLVEDPLGIVYLIENSQQFWSGMCQS